ncbi:MAG: hypothetical protein SFV32_00310 [Opitutaceae bacterium]|nr:hypothetical protein [Opitutaceae bacterium]
MKADFEPPKLSPWPFILSDIVLLGAAAWIGSLAQVPLQGSVVWAVAVLVGLGAISLGIPFLVNYSRRQDQALAERQKEIAALAEITANSAEQLGVAVAGLGTVVDAAHRAAKQAEHLPQRLQERVNEFKEQLNEVAVTENEALAQELNTLRTSETERIEAGVERIQKLVTEFRQIEERLASQREAMDRAIVEATAQALERIRREVASLEVKIQAPPPPTPSMPIAPAATSAAPEDSRVAESHLPAAEPVSPAAPVAPVALPTVAAVPPPQDTAAAPILQSELPAERRKPRKAREEDEQPGLDLGDLGGPPPEEPVVSLTSDGATRLLVTAYIGIGNKLFVRGDGPGLAADKGVPLHFVSIGKWRWESAEVSGPITLQLLKNDLQPALNVGSLTLGPGQQVEVKATF